MPSSTSYAHGEELLEIAREKRVSERRTDVGWFERKNDALKRAVAAKNTGLVLAHVQRDFSVYFRDHEMPIHMAALAVAHYARALLKIHAEAIKMSRETPEFQRLYKHIRDAMDLGIQNGFEIPWAPQGGGST